MEALASSIGSDIPYLFPCFLIVYLVGYFIVFSSWPSKARTEASSCFISLFHGTPAVFLSLFSLQSDPTRGFSSQNTPFQNLVLDYSISYFLTDLLHYLIFLPHDVLFIAHHLVTLFVFLTCRYLVYHGAYAILILLFLAEITSFCQNVWTLACIRKFDLPHASKVYNYLSPPFYTFYTVVRGGLGPWFVYEMGKFYTTGVADNVIPRWVWVSWILVVVSALCVSAIWISHLWVAFYTERKGKLLEKKIG